MNPIGIMQGRLSPPVGGRIQAFPSRTWEAEFALARVGGLDLIEWIFDAEDWSENPLVQELGMTSMKRHIAETGVKVASICADYFMSQPLTSADKDLSAARSEMLKFVVARAAMLGARHVTVPFVDRSAINSPAEQELAVASLAACVPLARSAHVQLCLETNLDPARLTSVLSALDEDVVKVTYDIGNSAALGHDPAEEIASYGKRIAVVHVKDRVRNGGTVPLGTGNADLPLVFEGLRQVGFAGPLILQVARRDNELLAAREDLTFVRARLNGQAG